MDNRDAVLEAFRRRTGQAPSSAGIPGGAAGANQMSAQNPLMSSAVSQLQPQGAGMSGPGIDQLGKSQPGEAQIILKALINRLKTLSPS